MRAWASRVKAVDAGIHLASLGLGLSVGLTAQSAKCPTSEAAQNDQPELVEQLFQKA